MQKIYLLLDKLNNELANHPRILALNKMEKIMENDEEVILLARDKEKQENHYNDALKLYSENSEEVINARKALYKAKESLESHPIVIEYLKCYRMVKELYNEINKTIFDGIKILSCPKK